MKFIFILFIGLSTFVLGLFASLGARSAVAMGSYQNLISEKQQELKIDIHDQGIALVFLSLTCPCAKNCLEEVRKQGGELQNLGYPVYLVNTDQKTDLKTTQKIFKSLNLPFPVLNDEEKKLIKKFQVQTAAELRLLNSSSDILYRGAIYSEEQNFLAMLTEDLSAKRPLRISAGSGLGCALSEDQVTSPF